MGEGISLELYLFGWAIAIGALSTLFYEIILLFRILIYHRLWAIVMEDILFWLSLCVGVFYFLLQKNDGIFRWYIFGGFLFGIYFFQKAVGHFIIDFMSTFRKRDFFAIFKKKRS